MVAVSQGDTTVVLDANAGVYYTLNEVGGRIWQALTSGQTLAATIAALQQEYDVAPDILASETFDLVRCLVATRLLSVVGP